MKFIHYRYRQTRETAFIALLRLDVARLRHRYWNKRAQYCPVYSPMEKEKEERRGELQGEDQTVQKGTRHLF